MSDEIRERRNVVIAGRRTGVSLEKFVWDAINDIAHQESISATVLVGLIDQVRGADSLASALRVFTLTYFRLRWATKDEDERTDFAFAEPVVMRPALVERVLQQMVDENNQSARGGEQNSA